MYAGVLGLKTVLGGDSMPMWHLLLLITAGITLYAGAITTRERDRSGEVRGLMRV